MPMPGCPTSTGAPQAVQNWRWLFSVLLYRPSLSAPFVTLTFGVGHRLAAWTGAPSQPRQELQWQYAWTVGSPVISIWTAPHAQPALYVFAMANLLPPPPSLCNSPEAARDGERSRYLIYTAV